MTWYRDLRLRTKFLITFGIILALVAVQSAFAYRNAQTNDEASDRVEHTVNVIELANDALTNLVNMQAYYRGFLLTGNETYLVGYEAARQAYQQDLERLTQETADNPDQIMRWQEIERIAASWQEQATEPGIALRRDVNAGDASIEDVVASFQAAADRAQFSQIRALFGDALAEEETLHAERTARAESQNTSLRQVIIAGTAISLAVAVLLAYLLARSIAGAASTLAEAARAIRKGNFGVRIGSPRRDELGEAAAAFDHMTGRLDRMVGELEETALLARENETRVRTVMEHAAEGILTFDEDGNILLANSAAGQMLGTDPAELVGAQVTTFLPGLLDGGRASQPENGTESPNSAATTETTGRRLDGSRFAAEMTTGSMPIDDHQQFVAIVRDVTRRKQAQAELQRLYQVSEEARGRARAILDAAGDVMIFVGPDSRVSIVNQRFSDLLGVAAEEVIGKRMQDLAPVVERVFGATERFTSQLQPSVADTEQRFEMVVNQQWPQPRELQFFSMPVRSSSGVYLGRLFVLRDVTHEREVDRMKTEFVSLVSHELRTPLTSIKGYVDLILDGEVGEISAEQEMFLNIVASNAQRLVALINDLLDISRIEAGRIELRRISLHLITAIETAISALRPQIDAKGQALTVEVPGDLPAAWGDPDRVVQIVTNLISNASKYTPQGGSINVTAQLVDQRIWVEIQDTGIGMSDEEQAQLFTKFYRARNRTTQEVGGTGLGLAISRSLVEMQGGTISVTSAPGEGSTFRFSLPVYIGASELVTSPAPLREGKRILVVEDEQDIANLIRRYLERAGYQVTIVGTVAETLEQIRTFQPDLITLDVLLPDGDGFSVLEQLHQDERTADIPVMLLSMLPDDGEGHRLGAVDFLTKPVNEDALISRIQRILPNSGTRTVLVVDDDEDIRNLIVRHVQRAGHRPLEASDGTAAVKLADGSNIDLALIDVKMPGMDGVDVLRELRANPATRTLPVIMMTVSPGAMEANRLPIEELDATLVRKSFTADELADLIGQALPARSET